MRIICFGLLGLTLGGLGGCAGGGGPGARPAAASPARATTSAGAKVAASSPGPTASGTGQAQPVTAPAAAQGLAVGAIQSQLRALVSLAQVGEPMTGLAALTQGQNVAQYFAANCTVTPWPNALPVAGANVLAGEIGHWLGGMQIGEFAIKEQYLKATPDRLRGRAIVRLRATLTYADRVTNYDGWYATDWANVRGNWLIQSVTPISVAADTKEEQTDPYVYFGPEWGPEWGFY